MAGPAFGSWNGHSDNSIIFLHRPTHYLQNKKEKPGNMDQRFVSIWFRYLITDWYSRRQPALRSTPFVLVSPIHNRIVITAANHLAEAEGIRIGMLLADARAIAPSLLVFDDRPELPIQLLTAIGEWCIRFTPYAAIDPPDGLILNVSGCTHLWGGEDIYLTSIHKR